MITTGHLARLLDAELIGDAEREITQVAPLDTAGPGALSFCSGGRWARLLESTRAGAVLLAEGTAPDGVVTLRHPEPRAAFARAVELVLPTSWPPPGAHPTAVVDPTASVHPNATLDPYVVVGAGARVGPGSWLGAHVVLGRDAIVGAHCRLAPHAVVMDGCLLGDRVWLQPGAVIGGDGFGHVPGEVPVRLPHKGIVRLEDDVEVGANACVDRAMMGETVLERGARLDNLVQVAHGARIGRGALLAAFAGVAGGARLGARVLLGGRAAVTDGVEVGEGAVLLASAATSHPVEPGAVLGGSPARPRWQWLRETAALRELPGLVRRVRQLEKEREDG